MSRPRARRHQAAAPTFGLSTWTAVSIVVAALITGLLLSLNAHEISRPYLISFVVAALVATTIVEIRGLFLTVSSLPLLFGIFTPLVAWFVAKSNISGHTDSFSKTMILSAVYPLAQYFPYLAITTVACVIIALLRWRRGVLKSRETLRRFDAERVKLSRAERQNRSTTTRVRELNSRSRRANSGDRAAQHVTVDELVRNAERRRREKRRGTSIPPRTKPGESVKDMPRVDKQPRTSAPTERNTNKYRSSLGDDLYS